MCVFFAQRIFFEEVCFNYYLLKITFNAKQVGSNCIQLGNYILISKKFVYNTLFPDILTKFHIFKDYLNLSNF